MKVISQLYQRQPWTGITNIELLDRQNFKKIVHLQECLNEHEKDMEVSFAVDRSKDKVCGVCMEVIWEKEPEQARRFGILSGCSHVYCLDCIRKWRGAKQFENKVIRY